MLCEGMLGMSFPAVDTPNWETTLLVHLLRWGAAGGGVTSRISYVQCLWLALKDSGTGDQSPPSM